MLKLMALTNLEYKDLTAKVRMRRNAKALAILAFTFAMQSSQPPDRSKQQEQPIKKEDISQPTQPSVSIPAIVNKESHDEESTKSSGQSKDCPDKSFCWRLATGAFSSLVFSAHACQ